MKFPPYLKAGDTIGIAATARKVNAQEIADAISAAHHNGYQTQLAPNVFEEDRQFAGTDYNRATGINVLLANPKVKAIWCARGGYGSVRLMDGINWMLWRKHPKWLCGFSDVTALHLHLQHKHKIASLHSEMMLNYAENTQEAHQSLFKLLAGEAPQYTIKPHLLNKTGKATGILIGGNLSVLYSMMGSATQPQTAGCILFLEDLDEYLYHIDRMMMALDRAGILHNLAALVVGSFSDMKDNAVPFGKTAEEIILDVAGKYHYPICFNFPAGHIKNNCAIMLGANTVLDVGQTVGFSQNLP